VSRAGLPNTQEGGTEAIRVGSMKRRLKRIPLARFGPETDGLGESTSRLLLKNLSGCLDVKITIGIESIDNTPVRPDQYPLAGTAFGTVQLTPINNFPDAARKVYERPVFQDPTGNVNENNPLPMDIPFGWEFSTRADEVEIEVVLTPAGWAGSNIVGTLVCEVTIEYNGQWWDVRAINQALSQVTLIGGSDEPYLILTTGE